MTPEYRATKRVGHRIDLLGQRFGRLLVIEAAPSRDNRAMWKCKCDCGGQTISIGSNLRDGHSLSCGCIRAHTSYVSSYQHGDSYSPEYRTWTGILHRCFASGDSRFTDYGGRGITVCRRWKDSYEAFLEDMGRRPSLDHSIERIDNDGNYEPTNCRWATRVEQGQNKRNNVNLEWRGAVHSISEWARIMGMSRTVLGQRLRRHSVEWSLTTPVRPVAKPLKLRMRTKQPEPVTAEVMA